MNLRRIAHSIVTRLLLFGIALVLFGSAVRYFVLTNFIREDLGAVVESQQLALASYIAHDVDYKILERQSLLRRMAEKLPLELLQQPDRLSAWLGERHDLRPLFSQGLFVTNMDGLALANYPRLIRLAGENYGDRDYIRAALAGDLSVGRPLIGRMAKVPLLPIAVPVKDSPGQVRAVLAGVTELSAPGFLDLLQKSRIGESGGFC